MAVIKHKEQRVGVFLDVQNLYHSAKHLWRARVNFREVLRAAVAGRRLVRAIAYVISTESEEERSFFEALQKIGIETKTKDLQIFPGGEKKADWDVGMTIDVIKLVDSLDAIVLVTGDGDFGHLISYIQATKGRQVEVIAFGRSCARTLKDSADDFLDLDEYPARYLLRKENGSRSETRRRSERT